MDLNSIGENYQTKLIDDAISIIFFGSPIDPLPGINDDPQTLHRYGRFEEMEPIWESEDMLKKIQKLIKENFERLYSKVERIKKSNGRFSLKKNNIFLYETEINIKIRLVFTPLRWGDIEFIKEGEELIVDLDMDENDLFKTEIKLNEILNNDMNRILYRFIKCFDNLPLGSIHKCPNCKKIFISLKRNKIYCTRICANKYTSKVYREKIKKYDPEKYENDKRNARKRARKSYENSVSSGVPAKRPRIDKEE
jgi:hypothetical protein